MSVTRDFHGSTGKLNVLEVCLSDGRGGLERYAANVVTGLLKRGHKVSVVARPSSLFFDLSVRKPVLAFKPTRYNPFRGLGELIKLAKSADVVHIHRGADLPVVALAKCFSRARPALVYTRHMSIKRRRKWSIFHRWMMAQVDRVLAVSSSLKADVQAMWPIDSGKIELLYPGVDMGIMPKEPVWLRPEKPNFWLGCFSRIEPAKGQHILVRSIANLAGAGIDVGAIIVGATMDGDYEQHLRRLIENFDIGDRVLFLGEINNVGSMMSLCDGVILPSQEETLGLVLAEAQLAGVAVVGSDAGGVRDIIEPGRTGLLFRTGDVPSLAEAITLLWRHPDYRRALARAGQVSARKKFGMQAHLVHLESIFNNLVRPASSQ